MDKTLLILAQAIEGGATLADPASPQYYSIVKSIMVITSSGLILAVILFFSVYFYRTRRTNRPRPLHSTSSRAEAEPMEPAEETGERVRVRKKRRERIREHRPRNPTLQETGGLPPVRSDNELPRA